MVTFVNRGGATGRLVVGTGGSVTSRLSLPAAPATWTLVYKTDDESIVDDDGLSDDSELTWTVPLNTSQMFRGRVLFYCSNAGADFKYSLNIDVASPSRFIMVAHAIANGATTFSAIEVETTDGTSNPVQGTGNYGCLWLEGLIENSGGSEIYNVTFQWAQNLLGVGPDTTTVIRGSYFEYLNHAI